MHSMDRTSKIKLLHAIQSGKKTVADLLPKRLTIKIKKVGFATMVEKYQNDELIDDEKFSELISEERDIKIKVKRV